MARHTTKKCPKCKGKGVLSIPSGEALRKMREKKGISLRLMAEAIGISAAHLSHLESGKKTFTNEIEKAFLATLSNPESVNAIIQKRKDARKLKSTK